MSARITQSELMDLVTYSSITGLFHWKVGRGTNIKAGAEVGSWHSRGYRTACIKGRIYKCHRLAWLYVRGEWPPAEIDHINGIKHDNRIANLRPATRSENMQNMQKPKAGNKAGFRGVSASGRRFMARIVVGGKELYLGTFAAPAEAHEAYLAAKELHHV